LGEKSILYWNMEKYRITNRFKESTSDWIYILAQVDYSKCCLIGIETGNRFLDPVKVKDPMAISRKEFDKITGGNCFTKI